MKIMIKAYLDKNLGDDMMIRMLVKQLKNHQFFLHINDKSKASAFYDLPKLKLCRPIAGNKLQKWLYIRKEYDAIIKVGGSIFQIYSLNSIRAFIKILVEDLILKSLGVKLFIVGCNIGPIKVKWGKIIVKWIIKNSMYTSVRDKESYKIINPKKRDHSIHYYPDMVLASQEYFDQVDTMKKGTCLGISTYRFRTNPECNEIFHSKMINIINRYHDMTKQKVLLFAFDSGSENDIGPAYSILDGIKKKELVEIIVYSGNIKKIIKAYTRCHSFISVRFHSAIIALKLQIPFIPIIYSDKMENMLDDIAYKGLKYDTTNIKDLHEEDVIHALINENNICKGCKTNYSEDALGHLNSLKKFLKG